MGDSEAIRSARRARLRMASGTDMAKRLEVVRRVIDELQVDQSLKQRIYEAVNAVFRTEKDLNRVMEDKSASAQQMETQLQKYRNAAKAVIILDYEFAYDAYIEEQLRVVHTNLRTTYRNRLHNLRHQKDKHVETRRAHGEYLKFIKASQIFYRQLVLELDRIHGGIPELRRAAQTWKDINGCDKSEFPPLPSRAEQQHLLLAVQRTLLILGDLSRWRASDLDGQKPNRGAALGYYHLANDIYPPSGIAWNQLALVELEGENVNYLQALYFLYRGLCATEVRSGPKVNLNQNLESVFSKVSRMMERKQLFPKMMRVGNGVAGALMSWFLWLQTMCSKGEDCPKFKELEKEVMSQLTIEIKKGAANIEPLLQKIVMINLGGDYHTANKLKENRDDKLMQSFFYYLRFNARTFETLLQLLNSELEYVGDRRDVKKQGASVEHDAPADKVTAIMHRTLPALRYYSVWFQSYWRILGADIPGFQITPLEVQDVWHAYIHCLNLLSSTFLMDQLPEDDYLLPEDEESLGFGPFFEQIHHRNWYDEKGLKPKFSDPGISRNLPNTESLIRIRALLADSEILCNDPHAPIAVSFTADPSKPGLMAAVFAYRELGESQDEVIDHTPVQQDDSQAPLPLDSTDPYLPQQQAVEGASIFGDLTSDQVSQSHASSEATSLTVSKDQAMNRMVDNLLEDDDPLETLPEEAEYLPPTTPHQQTFNLTSSPSSNPFAGSPSFDNFQSFYPDQVDFPLFSSSTSPQLLGTAQNRNRDDDEVVDMARRLSNLGRSGAPNSPLTRALPAFPSLPDESARIWGVGYSNPPAQALSPALGFARPAAAANQSPLHGNGYAYRGSVGSASSPAWPQYPSPTTHDFRRGSLPHPSQPNGNVYSSPSGLDPSSHENVNTPSPFGNSPGSANNPSGLGSAALGGSALPRHVDMGGLSGFSRRPQWPAS